MSNQIPALLTRGIVKKPEPEVKKPEPVKKVCYICSAPKKERK
jgi:hypothetical protein